MKKKTLMNRLIQINRQTDKLIDKQIKVRQIELSNRQTDRQIDRQSWVSRTGKKYTNGSPGTKWTN